MPTPAERQALLFLAAVLSLGTGVRVMRWREAETPPSAREALAGQLAAVDSALAARGRRGAGAPAFASKRSVSSPPLPPVAPTASRGETRAERRTKTPPVDLDTAPESVLVTLPGIGPALAKRIVQDRERSGMFGSATAFMRVPGIGEKTTARLAPYVTFSGSPRRPP